VFVSLGCGDSTIFYSTGFKSKLNNEKIIGDGIVFQGVDSVMHFKAMLGAGNLYYAVDIFLNSPDVIANTNHLLSPITVSVRRIQERDIGLDYYELVGS
jgi:hypothetical protein